MIQLKSPRELEVMAAGGRILAATHRHVEPAIKAGVSTWELDQIVETFIRSHPGATPSFKGLYGFPGSACISLNEEIVHGIPSKKRILAEGDIITIDIGVHYGGFHTDSAWSYPVGKIDAESQRLLDVTKASLFAGIEQTRVGNHIGDIGAAVEAVVLAGRFTVVRDLVGHGVGASMHEEPQVPNHGKPKRGPKLQVGLTIAIEPMVNAGGGSDADPLRQVDDRDAGWSAVRPLRTYRRRDGRRTADPDDPRLEVRLDGGGGSRHCRRAAGHQ